ncbi:esterase-like activity of phytase family protein [Phormidium sp. CCY1219]|uniref:esterase-like activity of phytase family protein n=1 Tax=Phormidium sp. CCY1219 TaxID=2886104 RepID=UPI002D1EDFF0|nr:esterase-like activity of phytase family protein [Phormidium sp. CCY1219]MEB3829116.1 esterase-like activity of phytase family protein [Phormidium sp. CCY1219]
MTIKGSSWARQFFCIALFSTLCIGCNPTPQSAPKTNPVSTPTPAPTTFSNSRIEYLGQVKFPTGLEFENTQIGGLSGITYDPERNLYYAISDDRALTGPARFYTLTIDLDPLQVTPTAVTVLLSQDNTPFASYRLDPEGIALSKRDSFFISSEGDVNRNIPPFIKEFNREGKAINTLPIPDKFLPGERQGIRNNLAFESLTLTRSDRLLYTATESALVQDGAEANPEAGSPIRILQYNLIEGKPVGEFLYMTEPVLNPPKTPEAFSINGVVELLAVDETKLLSLERGFTEEIGNRILLYEVDLSEATDIRQIESLGDRDLNGIQLAEKKLLLDLQDLPIALDNIEGMTWGPDLADGRRSLILISDNNFNPLQVTQVLAFAIAPPK